LASCKYNNLKKAGNSLHKISEIRTTSNIDCMLLEVKIYRKSEICIVTRF
jgi:hypothetical protein